MTQLKKAQERIEKLKLKLKQKKPLTINKLKKDCWHILSKYVRTVEQRCFTCFILLLPKERIAGHGWDKHHYSSVRFDLINVHTQCQRCNRHKHGDGMRYSMRLIWLYGFEEVKKLEERAGRKRYIFTREELQGLIKKYQSLFDYIND